jgi:ubiquitin C-terminal hydrolase
MCWQDGQQQDAEEFFRLYLDALDEELTALLTSGVEESEVSQSGPTDVGNRDFAVR